MKKKQNSTKQQMCSGVDAEKQKKIVSQTNDENSVTVSRRD